MADFKELVRRQLSTLNLSEHRISEIADEIAEHLEDKYRQLIAAGRTADDADQLVRRELDAPGLLARRVHHAEHPGITELAVTHSQGQRLMSRIANDIRMGLRSLRKIRGATALAVVAFALGIGITTTVFSVFYGVLLKPLPYPDSDRMVVVYDIQPACKTCPASYFKFRTWRARNTVFEEMAGINNFAGAVTGLGDAERVTLGRATWTVPAVFRVQPEIGRWFSEAEDSPGGDLVAVLGHQFWVERFGGDTSVLGRGVTIDGAGYKVIGVMPEGFQATTQIFKPLQMAPNPTNGGHFLPITARLKPGVTVAQAQKEMVALGGVLAKEFGHNHGIDVQSYPERVLGAIRPQLRMLMGAVILVLLIACANIANLLLASGTSRRREFGLRAAIGATKWDLARQMIVESVALALTGGAIGLGIAYAGVRAFSVLGDQIVPRAATVSIDATVVLFALGLSLVTGVFCALWPVIRLDPARLAAAVREGDARGGTDAASRRFGSGLVVAEVALAFTLLAGSALLVKDLLRLEARPIGFRTDHVIAFDLQLASPRYNNNPDAIRAFQTDFFAQVPSIPGVEKAAATRNLPMYNAGWNGEVSLKGGNPWQPNAAPLVEQAVVTTDYFSVFGMPIRAGRAFDDSDRKDAEPVAIITSNTAEKFWPGQNPIGRLFTTGSVAADTQWLKVIGVVDDVRAFGLQSKPPYQMFVPASQQPSPLMTVILRVKGDNLSSVIPGVREVVKRLDPSLPVAKVQTMADVVSKSVSQPRLISVLTAVFAALAGLLAAVGVYGVMAYNVRRDRRQFGIQLALGADPARVRRAIISRGVALGGLGILIGGAGAWLLTGLLKSMLAEVKPGDPWIFAGTAVSLLVVSVAACAWPAFQAGRTDPMVALRAD